MVSIQMVIKVVLVLERFFAQRARQMLIFAMLSNHMPLNIRYLLGLIATNATVPHRVSSLINQFGHVIQHTWNAYVKSS